MKLEHNLLIQGLIELKWMSKEAVPLLSTKMYEVEASTVGKLRAHGITSEAIFEAAIFANETAEIPLPIVDLSLMKPIQDFDFATFASLEEMLSQFVVPIMQLGERLIVATADPSNAKFFDLLALRSPFQIEYWIAESEAIKALLLTMNIIEEPEKSATIEMGATSMIQEDSEVMVDLPVVNDALATESLSVLPMTHQNHERIEPTLGEDALEEDIVLEERIVTQEFVDEYPEEENIRYVDLEEIADHSDSSDRFTLLQDSALDVDELESKSQETEGETLHQVSELDETELEALVAVEETVDLDPTDDQDLPERVEAVVDHLPENAVALENLHDALEPMALQQDNVTTEAPATEEDISHNSAIMLREVLDEVGASTQGLPAEDDIVEYINYVLLDAITQKASDIHFEPYESSYRIRFRIDGILHKVYAVPEQYRQTIASRLKVMAELDIAEKRLPQDGHITICLGEGKEEEVDARISVIPTLWGEKVVIRLLDRSEMNVSLMKLGLSQNQRNQLQSAIERSQGLVLVTGPTGSGKTVTLYACLNHLNQASRNIATVEDPVEINLEGVNQLQVHPKIGLDFAEALRAFLRQDPDVLMVGEIRDYETADITMKAAQTGHLVLSTLHTNSAVESLLRLHNMGVETYNVASTVKLIVAQRLVRELCHCKEEDIVDSGYLETLGFTPQQAASKFFRASSCLECHDGYRGRFAIFEVMPISKRMEQLMLESAPASEIRLQAEREGVKNLRQAGIDKIMEGRTSLEEVLRVTTE